MNAHPEVFIAAGIDPEQMRRCFAEAIADFSTRAPARPWEMSEAIVSRYRGEVPFHRGTRSDKEVEATGLLRVVATKEIPFTHELSRHGLVARVAARGVRPAGD